MPKLAWRAIRTLPYIIHEMNKNRERFLINQSLDYCVGKQWKLN